MKQAENLLAFLSIILTAVVIVLMSEWAAPDSLGKLGYLGSPNFDSNIFSMHPVMMICGVFPAIVFAVNSSKFCSKKWISTIFHMTLHFCAVIFICIGLSAIIIYQDKFELEHLRNSHAWVGVIFIILFFTNLVVGIVKIAVKVRFSAYLGKIQHLHTLLGIATIATIIVAIATGIQSQQSSGQGIRICSNTAPACKLVNSLTILTLAAGGCVIFKEILVMSANNAVAETNNLTTTSASTRAKSGNDLYMADVEEKIEG